MSIEFSGGKKKIVCDECESDMSDWYPTASFVSMIEEAKTNGRVEQVNPGHWKHTCDDCLCDEDRPGGKLRAAKALFGF